MQGPVTSSANYSPRAAVEAIDHLTKKICALWGTPEFNLFIRRLIMDSRDGSRRGLPMEVAGEMVFLAETNRFVRAIAVAKSLSIPFNTALERVDAEDDQPLKLDILDDPLVSRDTMSDHVKTEPFNPVALAPVPRYPRRRTTNRQATGLSALFLKWLFNKWLWILALLAIAYRFLWPGIQTLL